MYKLLSGAKSVKQYRGDENLPEAKNGMKKGCGCKHSKSKYKYQSGERDIAADKLEYGDDYEAALKNNFGKELELPEGDAPLTYAPPVQKVSKTKPVVTRNIDTTKRKTPKTFPTVGGEKKIFIEKTPVTTSTSTGLNAPRKREMEYTARVRKYVDNLAGDLIPQNKTTYSLDRDSNKMVKHSSNINRMYGRKKLGYTYSDLTPEEQKQVQYEQKLRTANKLREEANILNKSSKYRKDEFESSGSFNKGMEIKGVNNMVSNVKKYTSSVEGKSKYKYGTGAVVIPEGSAIVTAKDGLGKLAVELHAQGKDPEVEKIIRKMPADNPTGKKYKYKKVDGADVLGLLKNPLAVSQATKRGAQYPWFKPFTSSNTEKGRISSTGESTLLDPNDTFNQYNNIEALEKKAGKKFNSMEDLQGYIYDNMPEEQRATMWKKFGPTLKSSEMTRENFVDKLGGARTAYGLGAIDKSGNKKEEEKKEEVEKKKDDTFATSKRGGDFLRNIPSLAEVAAKASILKDGPEKTAQNYLNLKTPTFVSQLDRTLRENAIAANTAKENIRDVSGGSAGSYLSNVANITAKRFDANNAAVGADTGGRNANMNEVVNIKNREAEYNTGLRNQFSQQDAANRGAYNNMLVSLGQSVDTATDASKLMSSQRDVDDIRTNLLKSGNYYMDAQGNVHMNKAKKGIKKLKTYKRR